MTAPAHPRRRWFRYSILIACLCAVLATYHVKMSHWGPMGTDYAGLAVFVGFWLLLVSAAWFVVEAVRHR